MNETIKDSYDQFSNDYDRFVNWESRLNYEMPFLVSELGALNPNQNSRITVLDTACGTGHHAIALSKAGFLCAGVDASSGMIAIAQANAARANLDIHFKQALFGQLAHTFDEYSFDGLLCLGNSIPHILTDASLANAMADFRSLLIPSGKLIIQNRNFDQVINQRERWMPPQTHYEGSACWVFTRFYDFEPDGLITFNIIVLSNQGGEEFQQHVISTPLRPISMKLLTRAIEASGFGSIRLYGDLQGNSFDINKSSNLVVIATAE